MKDISPRLVKFSMVGIVNTAITFVAIAVLDLAGVGALVANAIGFGLGLLNSYFLNSRFTFSAAPTVRSAVLFLAAFAVSYAINLAVLIAVSSNTSLPSIVCQLLALVSYNVSFFSLMRLVVFAGVR